VLIQVIFSGATEWGTACCGKNIAAHTKVSPIGAACQQQATASRTTSAVGAACFFIQQRKNKLPGLYALLVDYVLFVRRRHTDSSEELSEEGRTCYGELGPAPVVRLE
jgi:hypothetical protein